MRPVNLMPPEEGRGSGHSALRTGGVPYVLLAALGVVLLGVIAVAFTSKQISDREAEKQNLTQELAEATTRAQNLRPFADFRAMQESRTATVASLAQSRFDWERVMHELSLVIPTDVWLVNLTGTVSPSVEVGDAAGLESRSDVAGPALELVGCAVSQDAVAGLIASLEDIDGVTRVGFDSSEQPDEESAAAGQTAGSDQGTEGECRTREFITKFEIVVAFDAVPTPATATEAPAVPAPLTPGTTPAPTEQAATGAAASDTQAAANLIPGG
jgi:Tfp pilus assembly protein PilN